jgi:hypothetical protein
MDLAAVAHSDSDQSEGRYFALVVFDTFTIEK